VVRTSSSCAAGTQARNAYIQGASAVFLINDDNTIPPYSNFPLIDFAVISYQDGNYLLSQIAANANITLSFSFSPVVIPNTFSGNITSPFSGIGPTFDLQMAPTILAPGTNIIGVVPTTYSNWSITDGTSWSTAFASGSAALYLAARGVDNCSPLDVREALEFAASPRPVSVSDNTLESVAAQGAGKTQIFDSIYSSTIISPTELLLNDTAYFESIQYITITNSGNSKAKYQLSNVPAGTAPTFQSVSP
jgi:hypothetical protein